MLSGASDLGESLRTNLSLTAPAESGQTWPSGRGKGWAFAGRGRWAFRGEEDGHFGEENGHLEGEEDVWGERKMAIWEEEDEHLGEGRWAFGRKRKMVIWGHSFTVKTPKPLFLAIPSL